MSSDSGLLLVCSFVEKLGLRSLLESLFPSSKAKDHSYASILEQLIYTTITGYPTDEASDFLRNDPVFTGILGKDALASQPTVSRCINDFSESHIESFNHLLRVFFKKANPIRETKHMVLDLDATLFETHWKQENSNYYHYYGATGYHPFVLFNGLSGDLMQFQLRKGSQHCSNGIVDFLSSSFNWLDKTYPKAHFILRADSGFATPKVYELCESYGFSYAIKLKLNARLINLAHEAEDLFMRLYGTDYSKDYELYSEFYYQAASWKKAHRVVCRLERDAGEMLSRFTFIVTTMKASPKKVFQTYNKRGNMENFIKESKLDFFMNKVSHSSFIANTVKSFIKALAYNLIQLDEANRLSGKEKDCKITYLPYNFDQDRLSSCSICKKNGL